MSRLRERLSRALTNFPYHFDITRPGWWNSRRYAVCILCLRGIGVLAFLTHSRWSFYDAWMIEFTDIGKVFLVGDIHGKIAPFHAFVQRMHGREVAVVQVGDFGHGFLDHRTAKRAASFFRENAGTCGFIRGNHDDPQICRTMPGWIPDGHYDPNWGIMFVGGAFSVDQHLRTQGLDWWEDEECSIAELNAIVDRYAAVQPRIMVTHDAPAGAIRVLFPRDRVQQPMSRTMQALNAMLELHRPDLWIFGHWHRSAVGIADGTRFQCLGELRYCSVTHREDRPAKLCGGAEWI